MTRYKERGTDTQTEREREREKEKYSVCEREIKIIGKVKKKRGRMIK